MKIRENQNSVKLADKSAEFHKKSAIEDHSAKHVILHVLYHLITIPCHLHQEIKEKNVSRQFLWICTKKSKKKFKIYLPREVRQAQRQRPINHRIWPVFIPIHPIFGHSSPISP
jgi:hypothetical protein